MASNNPLRPTVPYGPRQRAMFGGTVAVPRDLPPAVIEGAQPAGPSSTVGQRVRLPGVNFPPEGAIPVDEDADANIAPGATATILTYRIPDTVLFRITGIGFGADDEVALRFLTWSIRVNGDPNTGYTVKNAVIGSIVQPTPIFLVIPNNATLTVQGTANALAAVTYRYIVRVIGWLYQETGQ